MPLAGSMPTPKASAPIAVVGDALVEELREKRRDPRERLGGAALRVACDLSALGSKAVLAAAIGADGDGTSIRRLLREHDVELLPTVDPDRGTGRQIIERRRRRDRLSFSEDAAARRIRFDLVQEAAIARAPIVVVAGFPFDDRKQQRRLLAAVAQPQNRLVLDANPREGLIADREAYRANLERHASSAFLVHLSSSDAELLFEAPIDEATSHLLDLGARHVLATEGSSGSRWVTRDGIDVHVPIRELPGEIVDLSGAGDAVTAVAADVLARFGGPGDEDEARIVLERAMALAARVIRRDDGILEEADLDGALPTLD